MAQQGARVPGGTSSDSSSDEEMDPRLAAVAVSFAEVAKEQERIAQKGRHQITGQKGKGAQPASGLQAVANTDDQEEARDAHRTGSDLQPLGIVERRIAAALEKRLERLLPPAADGPATTAPSPGQGQGQGQPAPKDPRADQDLGTGVRLFRRVKRMTPVIVPQGPDPATDAYARKRHLSAELLDGVKTKRTHMEVGLLERLLQLPPPQYLAPPSSSSQPLTRSAPPPPPQQQQQQEQQQKQQAGRGADGSGSDSQGGQGAEEEQQQQALSAADEFKATIKKAIKRLKNSLAPKDQIKALKKALKHSAMEGAAILKQAEAEAGLAAAAAAQADVGKKKKKKKKKKQKEGAEGEAAVEQPARPMRIGGTVIEPQGRCGLTDVPFDVRTAKLLGLPN